jgi:outer membrane protein OmpA-like peptidoglycan-associated protein
VIVQRSNTPFKCSGVGGVQSAGCDDGMGKKLTCHLSSECPHRSSGKFELACIFRLIPAITMIPRHLPIIALVSLMLTQSHAQMPSDPGDPPHLKRYEGSVIFAHKTERYTRYLIPLSKWQPPSGADAKEYDKSQEIEGNFTRLAYVIPDSEREVLEVHRNYLNELDSSGWEILHSAVGEKEIHPNFGYNTKLREPVDGTQLFEYPTPGGTAYIAARRADPDGDTYATITTFRFTNNGLTGPFENLIKPHSTLVRVDLIKPKAMEQRMVFIDAAAMKSEISQQGRVSLYGVLFEFNKTDIKPESQPTLAEVAKLLQEDPSLKLLVVGHTDNIGTLDFNKDLSARRATSVVSALVKQFGIAANRLHPEGVAFLAPIAASDTEEGRSKNRRVELVRW